MTEDRLDRIRQDAEWHRVHDHNPILATRMLALLDYTERLRNLLEPLVANPVRSGFCLFCECWHDASHWTRDGDAHMEDCPVLDRAALFGNG